MKTDTKRIARWKSYTCLALLLMYGFTLSAQNEQPLASPKSNADSITTNPLPLTTVSFLEDFHDFGEIQEGMTVHHTFTFKNTGNHPLRCADVFTNGIAAMWVKNDVLPQAEGSIIVEFHGLSSGVFEKIVSVVFENTDPSMYALRIQCRVVPKRDFIQTVNTLPLTMVAFKNLSHDFGTIREGDQVKHTFTFKNTGKHPLRCTNVRPTCSCTTVEWSKEDIAPGKKGFITIVFDSKGKSGLQKKGLAVTF